MRAKEWVQKNKNKSFLLTGEDLRDAEKWQAEAGTKEPRATALHAQYILASRQADTRRQRITLGAVIGGLIVGLSEAAAVQLVGANFRAAVAFLLLIAVLLVRPTGLFGGRNDP